MRSIMFSIVFAAIVAAPAHAQLPFALRDCLADRDADARLHICSIMSGTEEEKALSDMQGAIADFRQVIEENPEHIGARQALADMAAQP